MSSDRTLSSRLLRRATLPLAVAVLLAPACGRKEDPQPPPRKNPAKTTDLTVRQRGQVLYVTMAYPAVTMGGLALPGIDRVEYERYTRPAPEFMEMSDEAGDEEATSEEAADEEATGATEERADPEASEDESVAEGDPSPEDEADETGGVEVEELEPEEGYEVTEEEGAEGSEEGTASEGESFGTETPEPNPFLRIRVDLDDFEKRAEEVLVLEATELESAIAGGEIVVRFPLDAVPTVPPVAYSFRVRTFTGRLKSPESNIASFVPLPVPDPPGNVTLEPSASGVRLTWEKPEGVVPKQTTGTSKPASEVAGATEEDPTTEPPAMEAPDAATEISPAESSTDSGGESEDGEPDEASMEAAGDATAEMAGDESADATAEPGEVGDQGPIEIEGYNLYRRLAESTLYPTRPLTTLQPDETEYVDRSAQFGSSYVYAVTTARMRQPLVESELGEKVAIEYEDDFAPQAPRGLVLLAETGRTRLVWEANDETDVDGYLVFVRQGDGAFEPLTPEPIAASEFVHRGTTSGATYTYRVVAIDTAGNESAPSREATTRAP